MVEPEPRERWNARYRSRSALSDPPLALENMAHLLPEAGLALDLAGGDGAGAQLLDSRGLSPVLVEVSDVALALARSRTMVNGPMVAVEYDLSGRTLGEALVAAAGDIQVAAVVCFHYLERTLLSSVAKDLPPGAVFACAIATTTNLERNERPSRRFLLEPGELRSLVLSEPVDRPQDEIELLHDHEGWNAKGQHEAQLAIRRIG